MSDTSDPNDWNAQVIAEFRDNDGKVGGPFEGAPMVLLHHEGARSGTERVTPLMAQVDGDTLYVFASKGGAPDNPDWYHNVKANPDTTIELGPDADIAVHVVELEDGERDRVWEAQKAAWPQFAGYEEATDRTIPVLALHRR